MKRLTTIACLLLAPLATTEAAEPATPQDQQTLVAIREVQAQQAVIAENQAKIEQKLAAVMEEIRVARIYSSRSGSSK